MTQPRCWIDTNNVVCFRSDVDPEEVDELQHMVSAAFNQGVASGYAQGRTKTDETRKEKR